MTDKITHEDIFAESLKETRELTKELDRLLMRCEKRKEIGIKIEDKTVKELLKTLKDNNL